MWELNLNEVKEQSNPMLHKKTLVRFLFRQLYHTEIRFCTGFDDEKTTRFGWFANFWSK
jgi:hypothetical protein